MNSNNINFIEEDECPKHDANYDIPSFKDVYHGLMSREVAVKILKETKKDKSYLIRKRINQEEDENYQEYILSFMHNDIDYHFKFKKNKKYFIFANRYYHRFKCLIYHYMISFIIKDVCLEFPVLNKSLVAVRESLKDEKCYLAEPIATERLKEILYKDGPGSYLFRLRTDDSRQFVLMFFDGSRIHKLKMDVCLMEKAPLSEKTIDNNPGSETNGFSSQSVIIVSQPSVVIVLGRNYFSSWQELVENFTKNPLVPIPDTNSGLYTDKLKTAVNVNISKDKIEGDIYRQIKFSKAPCQKDAYSVHGEVHYSEYGKKKWKLLYGCVDKDNCQLILDWDPTIGLNLRGSSTNHHSNSFSAGGSSSTGQSNISSRQKQKNQPIIIELIKCNFIPIDYSVFRKYCFMLEHKDGKLFYIAMVDNSELMSHSSSYSSVQNASAISSPSSAFNSTHTGSASGDKRDIVSHEAYSYRRYHLMNHDKEVYYSTETDRDDDVGLGRSLDRWTVAVRRHCANTKDDVANEEIPERHTKLYRYSRRIKLTLEHNSGGDVALTENDLVPATISTSGSALSSTGPLIQMNSMPSTTTTSVSSSSNTGCASPLNSASISLPAHTGTSSTSTGTAGSVLNPQSLSNNDNAYQPSHSNASQGRFEVYCQQNRYLIAVFPRKEAQIKQVILFHDLPSDISDISIFLRIRGPKRKDYFKEITRYTISQQQLQPSGSSPCSSTVVVAQSCSPQSRKTSSYYRDQEHSHQESHSSASFSEAPSLQTTECNAIIDYKMSVILPFMHYSYFSKHIMENCEKIFNNQVFFKSLLTAVEQGEFRKLLNCFLYMAIWEKKQIEFLFIFIQNDLQCETSPDLYFRTNSRSMRLICEYLNQFADEWLIESFVQFFLEINKTTDMLSANPPGGNINSSAGSGGGGSFNDELPRDYDNQQIAISEETRIKCLEALLKGIANNVHRCPLTIRKLLYLIQQEIDRLIQRNNYTPSAEYRLITNFIIFRFFCPIMNSSGGRREEFLLKITEHIHKDPNYSYNFPHNINHNERLFKFMQEMSKQLLKTFSAKSSSSNNNTSTSGSATPGTTTTSSSSSSSGGGGGSGSSTPGRPQNDRLLNQFIDQYREQNLASIKKQLTCELTSNERAEISSDLEKESTQICRNSSLSRRFNEVLEFLQLLREDPYYFHDDLDVITTSGRHPQSSTTIGNGSETPGGAQGDDSPFKEIFTVQLCEIIDKINSRKSC